MTTSKTVKKTIRFIDKFIQHSSFGGVFLLFATMLAMYVANSSFSEQYFQFWEHTNFAINFGNFSLDFPLHVWVNDALMAVFFLMVGLEIKRELVYGELSSFRRAAFPILAAIGGMIVPATIYLIFNFGTDSQGGFGIPMATDIAFALGVTMLLGKRVPIELKIFLVTFAVVDDLGAILVIAIFYASDLSWSYLFLSAIITSILCLFNYFNVKRLLPYLILGLFLWYFIHHSGIHATLAGVILAFTIPLFPKKSDKYYADSLHRISREFSKTITEEQPFFTEEQNNYVTILRKTTKRALSPLIYLEHFLHPWSTFFIMPIFAFANAGVKIQGEFVFNGIFFGIALGLLIGKPVGVLGITYLADKFGIAKKSDLLSWMDIFCAGVVGGIGFTMSIFIAGLAFPNNPEYMDGAKITILITSLMAGLLGIVFFILKSTFVKK